MLPESHGLRRGFTGLSAIAQTVLEENPFSGHVFVFRGRRGDLIKLLWWDGDGLCLFAKRLERGRFIWSKAESGTISLTRAQLSMLLEGIDWRRPARSVAPLPDLHTLDAAALRDMVVKQHAQISSRDAELERLRLIIARLRRLQYGRKSEKIELQIEQLELQLEDLEARTGQEQLQTEHTLAPATAAVFAAATRKPVRRPLPDHLPREVKRHEPEHEGCPACGGTLRKLGEDVSEVLEYVPAQFKVIRHVRPKLSCTKCDAIVQAEAPGPPIERGLAGPGLLAHVLVSKYADHLPLYRQSEIYAREGVELERSTRADWVGRTSELLKPLNEALRQHVMSGSKLHADDTPVPMLAPGVGKTKLGRLWTYVRDDRPAGEAAAPAVWFAYSPDRRGEHPHRHLATFHGTLQADGYAGFNRLYDSGRIREAACWAHVRRKFFDLHQAHASPLARETIERIGQLYAIENEIRGRSPEERQRMREIRSRPLLTSLHAWFKESLTKLSRKSEMAAAISYALGRWSALMRYCEDGLLEIDNNAAERALRAVALGRKNYLFAGSDSGGERAAAIYSLIGSAKLNGLDPEAYLRYVLACIADHPIIALLNCCPGTLRNRRHPRARTLSCRRSRTLRTKILHHPAILYQSLLQWAVSNRTKGSKRF